MAMMDAPRISEMPEDEAVLDENLDGVQISRRGNSATVDFAPGMRQVSQEDSAEHSANLVDSLTETELKDLANEVIEWVETDVESRSDWQQRMDQAMELLGLENIPGEELPFDGASAVSYPMIAEAVVQFQARAIEEIFPSEGPVKVKIVGAVDMAVTEQAERVKNHMNYQILDQDRSYFWNVDSMLFYLPLGGSAFKKTYYDNVADMVVSPFIKSEDFIVPYIATSLPTAPRYTHRMHKNTTEMRKLFSSGFYREIVLPKITAYASDDTGHSSREYEDTADSRSESVHEKDAMYQLLECHCDLELTVDEQRADHPLPYIVTVERETRSVLSIRRNWKEDDALMQKRVWFTHYKYLPGLGFYGFGLLHLIGSLAEATTGSIRALLDSAAFANMQGGYVSNDAKFQPGDEHIEPGTYKEVNMSAEELQRAFYTPPFKDPSPAMAQLLEQLIQAGKSFSSATEVLTGEAKNTGPVGTTIALIEQGSKPFSAIHRRLHMAAAEEFKLRAELNYEFLPDQYPYRVEDQESVILRQDYDGRIDVIPISDPNIFSTTQRIAQGQALIELADGHPSLYNQMAVHERFLKAMRIPDYEELLQKREPLRLDPVNENMQLMQGGAATAFIEQDHDAHIAVHVNFLNGLAPEAVEMIAPALQAHLAEHYAFKYFNEMNANAGGQLPPPGTFTTQQPMDPQMEVQMSQLAASLPEIQIMEGGGWFDAEEEAFAEEQRRKDEEHYAEMRRKDEQAVADIRRRDLEALSKEDREDWSTEQKAKRDDEEADAKKRREDMLATAKAARERKAAAAKPKSKA